MHIKPTMWTLQPQLTAAPSMWRDTYFCLPIWEGTGNPHNISPFSNGPDPDGSGTLAWVLNEEGRSIDYSSGYQKWIEAEQAFIGASEFTIINVIQANTTGIDSGWWITGTPSGSDALPNLRYDSDGFAGGGTNVVKYGFETTSGTTSGESASNVQTTDLQHIVMRWRSGDAPELFIDGVKDTPTSAASSLGGTLGGSNWSTWIVGQGSKDGGSSWNGNVKLHFASARYWTDDEIWNHFQDPYAMLRPAGF